MLDIFKIMVGQLHGDDIFNVVELRNDVNFALNRIGFNDGHYLSIREHPLHFNSFKRCDPIRHGIGAPIKTADNNTRNRHTISSNSQISTLLCKNITVFRLYNRRRKEITADLSLELFLTFKAQIKLM